MFFLFTSHLKTFVAKHFGFFFFWAKHKKDTPWVDSGFQWLIMGNTNTNPKRIERPYSIDIYGDRRGESPRPDDSTVRAFDFSGSGKRRPVLCYQSSLDYGTDETNEDFKVVLQIYSELIRVNKFVSKQNYVNSSSQGISAIKDQMLPTVFKWDGKFSSFFSSQKEKTKQKSLQKVAAKMSTSLEHSPIGSHWKWSKVRAILSQWSTFQRYGSFPLHWPI